MITKKKIGRPVEHRDGFSRISASISSKVLEEFTKAWDRLSKGAPFSRGVQDALSKWMTRSNPDSIILTGETAQALLTLAKSRKTSPDAALHDLLRLMVGNRS